MKKLIEKIIEKLEEECFLTTNDDGETNELSIKVVDLNNAIEIINQTAAEYNNGWIPCSERLPEDKQTCLVTARIYFTPDHVDEIDNYIGVGIDTYSKQFGWLGTEPIAWQPLPAPYQPKGE